VGEAKARAHHRLDRQGVDMTTPGGKALFQMTGVSPSSSAR
jgi:hypothetical protein